MASQEPQSSAGDPFGLRERFLIVCAEMEPEHLADALGVPQARLHHILSGHDELSADAVTRLCRARGISPLWMLAGVGPRSAAKLPEYFGEPRAESP